MLFLADTTSLYISTQRGFLLKKGYSKRTKHKKPQIKNHRDRGNIIGGEQNEHQTNS